MTESPPQPPVPWHRNPWVWGVLAGLVFVPAIRPLTRHVPEAPAVQAALPDFEFTGIDGRPVARDDLLGQVYVLGFAGLACQEACVETYRATEQLADRYQAFDREISVVLVGFDSSPVTGADDSVVGPADRSPEQPRSPGPASGKFAVSSRSAGSWVLLRGKSGDISRLVLERLLSLVEPAVEIEDLESFAHLSRLFLVDADGRLRGHYGIDESGLDEIYHRAQHVLRDYRKAHRWDR